MRKILLCVLAILILGCEQISTTKTDDYFQHSETLRLVGSSEGDFEIFWDTHKYTHDQLEDLYPHNHVEADGSDGSVRLSTTKTYDCYRCGGDDTFKERCGEFKHTRYTNHWILPGGPCLVVNTHNYTKASCSRCGYDNPQHSDHLCYSQHTNVWCGTFWDPVRCPFK